MFLRQGLLLAGGSPLLKEEERAKCGAQDKAGHHLSAAVGSAVFEILLPLEVVLLLIRSGGVDAGKGGIAGCSLPGCVHLSDGPLSGVDTLIGRLVQPEKGLSIVLGNIAAALVIDEADGCLGRGVSGLGSNDVTV